MFNGRNGTPGGINKKSAGKQCNYSMKRATTCFQGLILLRSRSRSSRLKWRLVYFNWDWPTSWGAVDGAVWSGVGAIVNRNCSSPTDLRQ